MTMLSSSSPVTATTTSGGRLMPARSSTKSSVASPRCTWCSNSASSISKRAGRCSIMVTSWPFRSRARPRLEPTLPPPAIRRYIVRGSGERVLDRAYRVRERLDRALRGTDDVEAPRLEELGPGGVEDPHDHGPDVEPLLRHLADDDVRVVAVGRDHDRVGVLDACLAEQREVHPVADVELARPVV